MDWTDCERTRQVKRITTNAALIESLISSANDKHTSQMLLPMQQATASTKVSLEYDCLREKLEALAIKHGWKIYNHDCYCAFLKEKLKESNLGDIFDKFRRLRNNIEYYGEKIPMPDAERIIKEIQSLTTKIDALLK